ncbi:LOW QUALITY PROTEIN: hypothetical protein QC764_200883 [Podospora pseudoanserina]|uniref:Uncharacterized protein n=1 Tax=Podospora pseudoanserina TaxID=2609844 RepID=A0ABR0IF90_9PEZI|nr:LOW QUALITY PROTEIN: hypothetical protein QC764_200883 [Podospora pseudoanserina]
MGASIYRDRAMGSGWLLPLAETRQDAAADHDSEKRKIRDMSLWESLTRSRPTNQTTHCSDEAAEAAPILPHRIKVRYCALLFAGWLAGWATICMKGTLDGGRGWLFFPSLCLFALLWVCVFGGGRGLARIPDMQQASKCSIFCLRDCAKNCYLRMDGWMGKGGLAFG